MEMSHRSAEVVGVAEQAEAGPCVQLLAYSR